MTDEARRCLEQDDFRLFHHGACHLFGVALLEKCVEEGYSLARIGVRYDQIFDPWNTGAYHVVARRDSYVVDATGVRRESDYMIWLAAHTLRDFEGTPIAPHIEMIAVAKEELLAGRTEDPHNGVVNEWGLIVDPEFVATVKLRASAFVDFSPDLFRVSLLLRGRSNAQL